MHDWLEPLSVHVAGGGGGGLLRYGFAAMAAAYLLLVAWKQATSGVPEQAPCQSLGVQTFSPASFLTHSSGELGLAPWR